MSTGWSLWVMFLVVLNLGITFFLFLWGPRAKIPTQPDGTSGHVWAHGVLREGVRRLPMWWILFSGAMFVAPSSTSCCTPVSATTRARWAGPRTASWPASRPPTRRSWSR